MKLMIRSYHRIQHPLLYLTSPYTFFLFFNIIRHIYKAGYIPEKYILEEKSYISNIFRAVVNDEIDIFSFLVQPSIYKIATIMENPNCFTCDKIEIILSTFLKHREIMLDLKVVRDDINAGKIQNRDKFKSITERLLNRLKKKSIFKIPSFNLFSTDYHYGT